jgi:hypothetical protein
VRTSSFALFLKAQRGSCGAARFLDLPVEFFDFALQTSLQIIGPPVQLVGFCFEDSPGGDYTFCYLLLSRCFLDLSLRYVSPTEVRAKDLQNGHPPARPSRLIPYPDIGYAERQAEALEPRYGCQAARLMASIAAEDTVHGRTFHCYCCQF